MLKRVSSQALNKIRTAIADEPYPTTRLVELKGISSVFEVTNSVEDHRAAGFGGEREQLEQFLDVVKEGDEVWDIGANVGIFSIFPSRIGCNVTAFEPDPGFASRLQRNIDLNGQDIQVREVAIGADNGQATLYTDGVDGMSPGLTKNDEEERGKVSVESVQADTLDMEPPDVVKIDVEGAEADVLRGMTNILESVEIVFVEIHPEMLPRFGDSIDDVILPLEAGGFEQRFSRDRNEQTHYIFER